MCEITNTSTAVIPLLLPHLNTLDNHLSIGLPRRIPIVLSIPKVTACRGTLVNPRLATQSVLKPTIGAANGYVQDEVEVVVERCRVVAGLAPRVDEPRAVGVGQGEVATLPERLVEVRVQDLQQARVNVGEEVLLAPLEAEGVECFAECRVQGVAFDIGPPPGVVGAVGAPMQR